MIASFSQVFQEMPVHVGVKTDGAVPRTHHCQPEARRGAHGCRKISKTHASITVNNALIVILAYNGDSYA